MAGAVVLTGTGSLSSQGQVTFRGTTNLGAVSSLLASISGLVLSTSADLAAVSSLAASGHVIFGGAASLTGVSEVASAAIISRRANAALDVTSSFASDGRLRMGGAAALTGAATLAANGYLVLSGTALLESFANLTAVVAQVTPIYAVIELELPDHDTALRLRVRTVILEVPVRDSILV